MLKTLYYIAVILTGIAAWMGFYFAYIKPKSPFNPKIAFGNPILKEIKAEQAEKADNLGLLSITLGIAASNVGGKPGCVTDMALSIISKTSKTRWSLMPVWFVDMRTFLRNIPGEQDIIPSVINPFSSVVLPANKTQNYSVFFMPRIVETPKVTPLCTTNLTPDDTYLIELFIVIAGEDCAIAEDKEWIPAGKTHMVLKKEDLEDLRKGLAVIPLDTVRDALREKFLRE